MIVKKILASFGVLVFLGGCLVTTGYAQIGNTVNGHVFGGQRQPVSEITVELLDDFSRTIARTRTDTSGRYMFSGLSSGRFRIRVLPLGTDFEEQEIEIEIQNFSRTDSNGRSVISGLANVQQDFYLRSKKTSDQLGPPEAVYIQEIPEQAKKLYDEGIKLLNEKELKPGLEKVKSAIEQFPDYYEALVTLGYEYIKLKHYAAADILLRKAIQVNSRSYKGWYGVAYSLYSLDLLDDASTAMEKGLALNSNSVEGLLLGGTISRKKENFKESEKLLLKANKLIDGKNADIHWQLALLYGNNLKRFGDAADELEAFLKIRPDSQDVEKIKKLIADFRQKSKKS